MKHARSMVVAGSALATAALVGWIVVTVFLPWFLEVPYATEHAGAQENTFDPGAESVFYGVVRSVDAAHRRIALGISFGDGTEQECSFNLTQDARVLLDGPATLDELAIGTRVGFNFAAGRSEIVAIRSEPFRITVHPKHQEVEVGKFFDVVLRVTNASPSPQSFWVWSEAWGVHWTSSNSQIVADPTYSNSFGNSPMRVTLAPGEADERTLPTKAMVGGKVRFRMRFRPLRECTNDGRPNLIRLFDRYFATSERTFWSGEVTLDANASSEKH